ncbi:MAG: alpha-glucan family phosphorylase [Deltaproteobacteria bacterium]|nr:alpha-glucan family phosphorylase [Candidatus Zymogenaceae bacterium]
MDERAGQDFTIDNPATAILREDERKIAYFSMEIGIDSRIATYSGGLGVLAADTIRSCADLGVPMVAVTLLTKKGYFRQKIDAEGKQEELPDEWNPGEFLKLLPARATVTIEGRPVVIQAWMYTVRGVAGHVLPVIFLDADVPENSGADRELTYYLYGGDQRYRLCQEVILGIGGLSMLRELGYGSLVRYHMNEGHSSLLVLRLLTEAKLDNDPAWDIHGVKKQCVFTTHTPVPAGMDQFPYDLVQRVLGGYVPLDLLKQIGGKDALNMTLLALNLSHYHNGVAKQHGKVSREMFPGYHIDSITNGVHSATWVCGSFKSLFDAYIPGWERESFSLRYALSIPKDEIWAAHQEAKDRLISYVNGQTDAGLDSRTMTIGFARRATAYKRADLIFHDTAKLIEISKGAGPIQLVFGGKAHPHDWPGKELIKKIVDLSKWLKNDIKVVYLENYDIELAKLLVSGVDLWLNTPRKPMEASGTSGMKTAHNGVPSISILDGWWIEGCIEGITGWAVGQAREEAGSDAEHAQSLYGKLEYVIIPMYYHERDDWIDIMRNAIGINSSFFNTHRMVLEYSLKAYSG